MNKIDKEELESLRSLTTQYNETRSRIADVSIAGHQLQMKLNAVGAEREKLTQWLSEKYGKTAVVNLETGEINHKIPQEDGKDIGIPAGQ